MAFLTHCLFLTSCVSTTPAASHLPPMSSLQRPAGDVGGPQSQKIEETQGRGSAIGSTCSRVAKEENKRQCRWSSRGLFSGCCGDINYWRGADLSSVEHVCSSSTTELAEKAAGRTEEANEKVPLGPAPLCRVPQFSAVHTLARFAIGAEGLGCFCNFHRFWRLLPVAGLER